MRQVTHKEIEWVSVFSSRHTACGLKYTYLPADRLWRKVTCRNCIRSRGKNARS